MVRVITNSLGSGDWVIVQAGSETLHEGHRVAAIDLVMILQNLGIHSELVECKDSEMEDGAY
jgi:hypothetical protein